MPLGDITITLEEYDRLQRARGPVWVHTKSNGRYHVLCDAAVEATLERVVVYQNMSTHRVWTRPYDEFHDGRFVREA